MTAVVIPARWASRRFPGKPLIPLAGVPMIARVVQRAFQAKCVSRVFVATDDDRIAGAARAAGALVVKTASCRTGTDRVAQAARRIHADLIVNVQGDEPLLDPRVVDRLIVHMRAKPQLPMGTVVAPLRDEKEWRNPNVVKAVLAKDGGVLYFTRSPVPYPRGGKFQGAWRHLGLYAYRRSWLLRITRLPTTPLERLEGLEQLRALENGFRVEAIVTARGTQAVDTPADAVKVEKILRGKK